MPNVHSHIATTTNNDWLEFWYVWWWIWLFILDIFVDCIKVGHSNRFNWCPIKRFRWNRCLVFRFSEQQLKRILSNGSNDTQCGAIIRQRRPQQTIGNVSVVNTMKGTTFLFCRFSLEAKTLGDFTPHTQTLTHSLTCKNRFQIAFIV